MGYNHHTYIIQNPQSKYISFEYNAIGAVVYCNPQSILVSLPINIGAFNSLELPSACQEYCYVSLVTQVLVICLMYMPSTLTAMTLAL